MPTGQSSRARRLVELTRSRQLLRRVLVLWGDEVLATVISRHSTVPPVVEDSGGMPPAIVVSFRQWAAKLSQPSVALLVEDDHIIIQQESELIASGSLAGVVPATHLVKPTSEQRAQLDRRKPSSLISS